MASCVDPSATNNMLVDDIFWDPDVDAITEDDHYLERVVNNAELPVLLAAISAATHDPTWLRDELRPPLTPIDSAPHPHGGMSPEQQKEARVLCLEGLKVMRDKGIRSLHKIPADLARRILLFLSNGQEAWQDMLLHELNIVEDSPPKSPPGLGDLAKSVEFSTLVIGAGVAGIAAAYRLKQSNMPFTIVETSDCVGGTWAKNTYPGVRLDTPTFGYSYSFAQKGDWPQQFAEGREIYAYLCDVVEKGDLYKYIEFRTRVISLNWDEDEHLWRVVTQDGAGNTTERAFNAVVSAVGQLDKPNIPDFKGFSEFCGQAMHSQEWDHSVNLTGKKVAVIGTGASAYQIVPAISEEVQTLTIFQRSAPWILPAPNYHDPMPDTFTWLRRKVPYYAQWYRLWVILTGIPGRIHTVTAEANWDGAPKSISRKNAELRQYLIDLVTKQLKDRPDLLEHAIPSYPPGAKRMLRDNGVWARALKQSNTTLVTEGIERFTPQGIVDGRGVEHEVDVVIFATGFKPSDYLEGIHVQGIGGVNLHEFWNGDARAYNGILVPHFPNLFLMYGPNIGGVVAGSLHFMFERAIEYVLKLLTYTIENGYSAVSVTEQALNEFVKWVDRGNRRLAWGQDYVNTWYQNSHGRVSQIWPYTNVEYWKVTEEVAPVDFRFID